MLYIGVDLGTSAVKLLLMDSEGAIRKIVSRTYPLEFPEPGWSEQNPYDWWEQTKEGIRELLRGADGSQVAGISFGEQVTAQRGLDDHHFPVFPQPEECVLHALLRFLQFYEFMPVGAQHGIVLPEKRIEGFFIAILDGRQKRRVFTIVFYSHFLRLNLRRKYNLF